MDRDELSRIAHRRHPIAAPLAPSSLARLLERVAPPPAGHVLDLGCGAGAWLVALLADRTDLRGVGVDLAEGATREATAAAGARGVEDRVTWVTADAATWSGGRFDTVLCVGAAHAFSGLGGALEGVRAHLRPGGRVVLGDGFWEQAPTPAALAALEAAPEDFPDLAGLVATVRRHGYEVGDAHVSTLAEWDDYEWSWTRSVVAWALDEAPTPAERDEALAAATAHRTAWLEGYRRVLGFATLVLHDVRPTA